MLPGLGSVPGNGYLRRNTLLYQHSITVVHAVHQIVAKFNQKTFYEYINKIMNQLHFVTVSRTENIFS